MPLLHMMYRKILSLRKSLFYKYNIWWCIAFIVLCNGCKKNCLQKKFQTISTSLVTISEEKEYEQFKEYEAQLSDVPFPLKEKAGSCLLHDDESGEDKSILRFVSHNTGAELIQFYEHEMERYGWNLCYTSTGKESLLLFEKPSRWCIFSIRPVTHEVILFTGDKKQILET
jgi:hypothetical protein